MAGNNTNIVHVEIAENFCGAQLVALDKIEEESPEVAKAKYEAQEYLRLYQDKQLKALRNACEES